MVDEKLVEVAKAHAAAEAVQDKATALGTLEDDPVYVLQPVGLAMRGLDAARTYYDHFFADFQPKVVDYELLSEYVSDDGVAQEYRIDWDGGAGVERFYVFAVLTFGRTKLSGEKVYASERLLRVMFGPAYDLATPID